MHRAAFYRDRPFTRRSQPPDDEDRAIRGRTPVGDLVFVAGQMATDFRTGVAPEAQVNPTTGSVLGSSGTRPAPSFLHGVEELEGSRG
jgi:hypothetical protein